MVIANRQKHIVPFGLMAACLLGSCELINPDEQIPAFLRVEGYNIVTTSDQGYPVHNLTDVWLYHNEELVGVYELPASIPVLSEGPTALRIRAGMRVSGQVGQRSSHPFINDVDTVVELVPDSHVAVRPLLTYRSDATFRWKEDFEDQGISLIATGSNQGSLTRIGEDQGSFAGQSLKMSLNGDQMLVECATATAFGLPRSGAPIILELSYRNNNSLFVGVLSDTPTGTRQTTIMALNPSPDEWKHVYVNVGATVSSASLASAIVHRPFFGFIRDNVGTEEAYAIIDNIKLIH